MTSTTLKIEHGRPQIERRGIESIEDLLHNVRCDVLDCAERLLNSAFQKDYSFVFFPVIYSFINDGDDDGFGGPPISDPTTIYISADIDGKFQGPIYSFTFKSIVRELIDDAKKDHDLTEAVQLVRQGLIALIGEMDEALKELNK